MYFMRAHEMPPPAGFRLRLMPHDFAALLIRRRCRQSLRLPDLRFHESARRCCRRVAEARCRRGARYVYVYRLGVVICCAVRRHYECCRRAMLLMPQRYASYARQDDY